MINVGPPTTYAVAGVLEGRIVDRADDSCARPGDVREGGGEHQVLGLGRNLRVGDLTRIGIATEHSPRPPGSSSIAAQNCS